jgi:transposase
MSNTLHMKNEAIASNQIAELEARCRQLEQQNIELSAKLKWFEEQFRLSKKRQFGASSEKSDSTQLSLFNEAEAEAQPLLAEPTLEKITYQRRKQRGHREAMLKDLPVEIIEYYPTEAEQTCDQCGSKMHEMNVEVRRELIIIPAQVKVLENRQHIYACRSCQQNDIKTPIVKAKMPNQVFKGSLASPSTMAYVMSQKYVDGLPLYRQEQQFARLGLELSRQNLANWVLHGADKWLSHIYNRLHQLLLKRDILHADETSLQVLQEPGRPAQSKSYLWLYRTGREGPPIVLYDYQETRGHEHPQQFLAGFKGYLHVDAYAGYHAVENVTLVGCFAHARRKFDEALKALPAKKRNASVPSRQGLDFCNRLFAIERDLKKATPEERYKARLERSRPVLDAFLTWLNEQAPNALPKTPFGQAVGYCLNQWSKLEAFMQDGRLEISNNRGERSMKPVVIGRKNWLFANTPRGARSSAIVYSIVETAKENGLNPFEYLKYLFEQLPNSDISDLAVIDKLLPHSDALPASCRIK